MNYKDIYLNTFITTHKRALNVDENEPNATVNKITFNHKGNIYKLNHKYLELNAYFKNTKICQGKSLTSICDGIFLLKHKNSWYFFICELKSNLGFNTFLQAKTQLEACFLKSSMFINILKDIKIEKTKTIAIIVSDIQDQYKINAFRALNAGIKDQALYNNLITKNKINLLKNKTSCKKLPIKDDYRLSDITLHFIQGNNQKINISTLIN